MLSETGIERVYLACGSTDLRKSIDGLAVLVSEEARHSAGRRNYITGSA